MVTAARARTAPDHHHLRGYYLGASLALWSTWQLSTLAGIQLGTLVPAAWGLEFTIPLTFLALLVPVLRDRPSLVAAAVADGGRRCSAARCPTTWASSSRRCSASAPGWSCRARQTP